MNSHLFQIIVLVNSQDQDTWYITVTVIQDIDCQHVIFNITEDMETKSKLKCEVFVLPECDVELGGIL